VALRGIALLWEQKGNKASTQSSSVTNSCATMSPITPSTLTDCRVAEEAFSFPFLIRHGTHRVLCIALRSGSVPKVIALIPESSFELAGPRFSLQIRRSVGALPSGTRRENFAPRHLPCLSNVLYADARAQTEGGG
jgi:hypothetical protein